MQDNVILDKSKKFAVRIIRLYQHLTEHKKEFILSKQVLRSGTSIGANVREAKYAQSRKDFIVKMHIALKESSETQYWLELLFETDYISEQEYNSIFSDCSEIKKILVSIVKTTKETTNS